jgi:hypothetical protein
MLKDFQKRESSIEADNEMLVQKNRQKVDQEMNKFMTTSQRNIKKQYDILYALYDADAPQEKIDQLQNQINKRKGDSEGDLFDPSTGELINKEDANEQTLSWNREYDKYKVKYTNNDREFNLRERDKLYFQFKYLDAKIAKQIRSGEIETPWSESIKTAMEATPTFGGLYDTGTAGMALWGGTALLDKYKDTFQQLRAINWAVSQNEDPAKLERSWSKSFASGLQESLGTTKAADIPTGFVEAQRKFGGYVSPEQEARLEKEYGEEFFETAGGSVPAMAKIIAVTMATEGLGFTAAYGSAFNTAKTMANPIGRALLSAVEPVLLGSIQYDLAGEGAGTGAGEAFGAEAYDLGKIPELLSKTKLGTFSKVLLNTFFKQVAMGGAETVQEYAGELAQRLYDDEEIGEALSNTIGEDPLRKLALTYELSVLLGSTAIVSNYKKGIKLMETEILKSTSNDPSIIALQQKINDKNKSKEEKAREETVTALREKAVEVEGETDAPVMENVGKAVESGELELTESITKAAETLEKVGGELTPEERIQVTSDVDGLVADLEAKGDEKSLAQAKELKAFNDYVNKPGTPDEEVVTKLRTKAEETEKVEATPEDIESQKQKLQDDIKSNEETIELFEKGLDRVDGEELIKLKEDIAFLKESKDNDQAKLDELNKTTEADAIQEDISEEQTIEEQPSIDEEVPTQEEQQAVSEQEVSEQEADVLTERDEVVQAVESLTDRSDVEKEMLIRQYDRGVMSRDYIFKRFLNEEKITKEELEPTEKTPGVKKIMMPEEVNWLENRGAKYTPPTKEGRGHWTFEGKNYASVDKLVQYLKENQWSLTELQRLKAVEDYTKEEMKRVKEAFDIPESFTEQEVHDYIAEIFGGSLEAKNGELIDTSGLVFALFESEEKFKEELGITINKINAAAEGEIQGLKDLINIKEEKTTPEYTSPDSKYTINKKGEVVYAKDIGKNKKAGDVVSEPTKRKVLREKAANESRTAPRVSDTIVMEEGMTPNDVTEVVIKESVNPNELAQEIENNPAEEVSHKENFIADYMPEKVSRASFIEFGDKNYITASIAPSYGFTSKAKGGQSLDTVAQEMSDAAGVEITPQDIVDFIVTYPQGVGQFNARVKAESINGRLKARFKQVTGLDYTAKAAEDIMDQAIQNELADQFADYPPEVLEAIEEYHKLEPDAETRYKEKTTTDETTEEVESTEDVEGVKKEPAQQEERNRIADKIQAGEMLTLDEAKFVKDQGIGVKPNKLEEAKKEFNDNLKSDRGELNAGLPVSLKTVASAVKLARLHIANGVKTFAQFLKLTKLKSSLWLRRAFDSARKGKKSDMKYGYRNLRSRISLETSSDVLSRLNEIAKGLKDAKTEQEVDIIKGEILDELTNLMSLVDIQLIAAKSELAKESLKNTKDYLLDFYARVKKSDAIELSKQLSEEKSKIDKGIKAEIQMRDMTLVEKSLQWLQDQKNAQEIIEKMISGQTKNEIGISESAYEMFDLVKGMVEDQNRHIAEYLYGSDRVGILSKTGKARNKVAFFQRLKDDGLTKDDIDLFKYAQHAPERNARVKEIRTQALAAEIKNINSKDFDLKKKKKLIAEAKEKIIITEEGSGMSNKDAKAYMDKFKKEGKYDKLVKYSKEFKTNVTDKISKNLFDGGIINEDQYNHLINGTDVATEVKFDFYTPLKVDGSVYNELFAKESREGYNNDTGEFKTTTMGTKVESLTGVNESERIKHHLRNSPTTQAIADLYSTTALVNRNKVHQLLHKMAKENPNKDVWEVKTMKQVGSFAAKNLANAIPVYVNGESHFIILKDKNLQKAWQQRRINKTWEKIARVLNILNSYRRSIFTILNPEFAIVNKVRDMQDAGFNLSKEESGDVIKRFSGYFRKSMGAIYNYETGRDTEGSRLMEEMMAHGGVISWSNYDNTSSVIDDIQKEAKKYHRRARKNKNLLPGTALRKAAKGVDILNATMEQSTRLAIYKAVRDHKIEALRNTKDAYKGMSIEQLAQVEPKKVRAIRLEAASASKNITVNFNKKGIGGTLLNTLYLFSNAGIQAAVMPFKIIGKKGSKAPKVLATATLLGGMAYKTWLNAMLDDDDIKDLLTDYDYENNIIIPIGDIKKGQLITIPKSYGAFRIFWNIGQSLADWRDTGNFSNVVYAAGQEISRVVNPVGGAYGGDPLIGFIPDIAKPAFELMANENYAGSDITKRSFDPHAKDYLTYKEKTPEVWKGLAGLMYEYVGLDAHPESYKHYFDAYFGGAWDTGLRTISPVVEEIPLVGDWLKKKELQMFGDKYDKGGIGNTPIGRRFYKDTSEEDWRIPAKMYKIFYEAKYEEDLSKEDVSNFYKFLGQSYNKGLLDKDPKKNLAKLKSKGKKFAETTNSFSQYKSLMKKLSKR